MLKGVNHRVVEIAQPESAYFERVLFFVKPEFSDTSESKLKTKADSFIRDTDSPPGNQNNKQHRSKVFFIVKLLSAAAAGAAATALIQLMV